MAPDALEAAADEVAHTEGVDLVGLMTLPPMPSVAEDSRRVLPAAPRAAGRGRRAPSRGEELSMGMSLDYPVAVEEGATMVRIGTALFGARRSEEPGRT